MISKIYDGTNLPKVTAIIVANTFEINSVATSYWLVFTLPLNYLKHKYWEGNYLCLVFHVFVQKSIEMLQKCVLILSVLKGVNYDFFPDTPWSSAKRNWKIIIILVNFFTQKLWEKVVDFTMRRYFFDAYLCFIIFRKIIFGWFTYRRIVWCTCFWICEIRIRMLRVDKMFPSYVWQMTWIWQHVENQTLFTRCNCNCDLFAQLIGCVEFSVIFAIALYDYLFTFNEIQLICCD